MPSGRSCATTHILAAPSAVRFNQLDRPDWRRRTARRTYHGTVNNVDLTRMILMAAHAERAEFRIVSGQTVAV